MTSSEIRQSFLDYFKRQGHTIVPSSSLLPDAPNLLFTNAGMNQFVPIFLGQQPCPYKPQRAADTQKCIRAGGKHNDLEDVGLDTYHHTFFEMLGNWSFGDYFKKEAIAWAWELVTSKDWWGFPKERLYATVYKPGPGDPSEFDQEAYDHWARIFTAAGLDPRQHIVFGNKKDNFWMMGDTGPCGPCSELHVDLTPKGDTRGALVNKGSAKCIEIWNLVFMQFNANPDGTFAPLPAKSVDTGAGFERVASIIQCTKNFSDFGGVISNYETDIFRPIFDELERMSGKRYASTLPSPAAPVSGPEAAVSPDAAAFSGTAVTAAGQKAAAAGEKAGAATQKSAAGGQKATDAAQEAIDIAFRVIADHIRCLSFAIADGIMPSNEGRGYVLRRILRRAVRYGRTLGFHEPFFSKLVNVLAKTMGDVFPEVRQRQAIIERTLRGEEESFNRTLDRGIQRFNEAMATFGSLDDVAESLGMKLQPPKSRWRILSAQVAFDLYDTYGFPLDLTELMAREQGLKVDVKGFEKLMEQQRQLAREDHEKKKTQIVVLDGIESGTPFGEVTLVREKTEFVGYDNLEAEAVVKRVVRSQATSGYGIILNKTPFYAEMGGQVGDTGEMVVDEYTWEIVNTQKHGDSSLHFLGDRIAPRTSGPVAPPIPGFEDKTGSALDFLPQPPMQGAAVKLRVDAARRANIQRHHTVTHLFHWALHEVVSKDARQRGSHVAPDRMRFDFNHPEKLSDQQIADIERLVNERIKENAPVYWTEVPYAEIKGNTAVMQFFGEKYGDIVRVVQVGGHAGKFDGYSAELCGGTHTRNTGDIQFFKIAKESAIAAGTRRVEAVVAQFALEFVEKMKVQQQAEAAKAQAREQDKELAKQRQADAQRQAVGLADQLLAKAQQVGGVKCIVANVGETTPDALRTIVDGIKPKLPSGVVVLGGTGGSKVSLVCFVTPDLVKAGKNAGKIVGALAKICGGGGGGRPDMAQAGGKDPSKLDEALRAVAQLI